MRLSEKIRNLTDKQIAEFNSIPQGDGEGERNYGDIIAIQELMGETESDVTVDEIIKGLNDLKYQDEYDDVATEIMNDGTILMGRQGGRPEPRNRTVR